MCHLFQCSHTVYPGAMASRKQRLRKSEADLVEKLDDTIQEVRDKQNPYLDAAFYNSIRSIIASSHQTQSRELRLKAGRP